MSNATTLAYGETFATIQDVTDFLYGYDRYLADKGFVFDQFSTELNTPIDWDLSTKEFLFWTSQGWDNQAVITLSPGAGKVKFVKENTTGDDLVNGSHYYTAVSYTHLTLPTNREV